MKKIWIFKNTKEMIISIILFILFLIGFIYIGSQEYYENVSIEKENISEKKLSSVFKEVSSQNITDILEYDNFILLFTVKNNKWVDYYQNLVLDVAGECGIDNIYYYDITSDKKEKNANYQNTVNYFGKYAIHLDDNDVNIYAPTLVVKKDGNIIYYNSDTSIVAGNVNIETYWDEYTIEEFKSNLTNFFMEYKGVNNNGQVE